VYTCSGSVVVNSRAAKPAAAALALPHRSVVLRLAAVMHDDCKVACRSGGQQNGRHRHG
jgi:hypothetical protein